MESCDIGVASPCLKFVQMCDEEGHDSLEEVATTMLNEEKVMETEECDYNPYLLAIVPYVNPSSHLYQHRRSTPLIGGI